LITFISLSIDDDSDTHNSHIRRVKLSPRQVFLRRFVIDDIPRLKGLISPLLVSFSGLLSGRLFDF
jgi:hypothetical protein